MWYYEDQGQSVGPVEEPELMEKLQSGSLPVRAMVWQEGFPDWIPASEAFPALAAQRASARPSPGGISNPYSSGGQANQPGGAVAGSYGQPARTYRPTPGIAIASLVLGIMSIVMVFCYLGPIVGIPAVICGHIATKRIKAENLEGKGMALAGTITGYVGIVLGLLIYALIAFAVAADL